MGARAVAAVLFGLTVAVLGVDSTAASKWLRVRSPHFVLVGDAGEGNLRQVALRVEAFREALRLTMPERSIATPVPTLIVVFGSDESFTPFKPLFRGKPLEHIGGYFLGGEDMNYITLNVAGREEAYSIVFHEFAHALINNTMTSVPVWTNEGLAELYRTFSERDGGRTAIIGLAPPEHVMALRRLPFMPLAELMGVGHDSPIYNEGERRGIFYAESWALAHYLLLGNEARGAQLRQYLLDLNAGVPSEKAFQQAFQTEPRVLENEVHDYVRRFLFPAQQIKFDQSVRLAALQAAEPLSDAETQAYLADLLAHGPRVDEAREQLERVLKENPTAPRALAALGSLHTRARRTDEAVPLLERAVALAPQDPSILASFGEALAGQLRASAFTDPELVLKTRTVLERAASLDQDNAHIVALRGNVEVMAGDHLGEARAFFERAVKMAPVRESYRFMLADVYVRQQDYAAATAQLGALMARGSGPDIKDRARSMMGRVVELRSRAARPSSVDAGENKPPRPEPREASPADATSTPAGPTARTFVGGGGRVIPDLRRVQEGETRVLGQFDGVECRPNGILLSIELPDRALRITAASFNAVVFIAYKQDAPRGVNCGRVEPPLRAYATYRSVAGAPSSAGDGQAVAIEILPDDYTPER